jgi:hypothetical protein
MMSESLFDWINRHPFSHCIALHWRRSCCIPSLPIVTTYVHNFLDYSCTKLACSATCLVAIPHSERLLPLFLSYHHLPRPILDCNLSFSSDTRPIASFTNYYFHCCHLRVLLRSLAMYNPKTLFCTHCRVRPVTLPLGTLFRLPRHQFQNWRDLF